MSKRNFKEDLKMMVTMAHRRQVLQWLAGASLMPFIGCGSDGNDNNSSCSPIPSETEGPYPGDGSNGPNALTLTGVARSDIRSSVGGVTGTADGVMLTIDLNLVNSNASCTPLAAHAIYLWHCTREGKYSMYDIKDQNYLRGIQATDSAGRATFVSIFPGCYSGRMPHIHFQVYSSLESATSASQEIKTSQLALPTAVCDEVYATTGYETSATNLTRISFSSDNVFRDGTTLQLAEVTGSVEQGYIASLKIAVAV